MEQNGGNEEFRYAGNTPASTLSEQPAPVQHNTSSAPLQWNASEFIDHQKNTGWFVPLILGSVILSFIVYFISRDILATLVIMLGCLTFGMYSRKKPRTITYALSPTTIKIGAKTYSYDDFRTFSIVQDGALFSIFLQPIKRFMPPLTIYFDPDDGEKIFDTLASHLPHVEREQDPIEQLMRRIRF
jgi:hypothetical protein